MPITLSQTQINRFIADPVEAVFCLFGIELAVPQRVRLKLMWTVPRVYDFSGVATGKSEVPAATTATTGSPAGAAQLPTTAVRDSAS